MYFLAYLQVKLWEAENLLFREGEMQETVSYTEGEQLVWLMNLFFSLTVAKQGHDIVVI